MKSFWATFIDILELSSGYTDENSHTFSLSFLFYTHLHWWATFNNLIESPSHCGYIFRGMKRNTVNIDQNFDTC